MFTGLVQATGVVESAEPVAAGVRLVVRPEGGGHRPEVGESIAVNGCCLTVQAVAERGWEFTAILETLAKTTLGRWRAETRVNLERSLRASDLMGGHVVQGHVDGVGVVE